MKFAEHLGSHLTPEWRTQYIQYEEMKKFLYDVDEKAPPAESSNEEVLHRHYAKYDEEFFLFCDEEIRKINRFFAEKLAEALRKFHELEIEIAHAGSIRLQQVVKSSTLTSRNKQTPSGESKTTEKKHIHKKKQKELRYAISEFYLSLVLLQNYQQLNFTGFRKILKKHDKMFRSGSGAEYRDTKVKNESFYFDKRIDELLSCTETIAIDDLEDGDRTKAMKRLRVPPLIKNDTHSSFFFGLFLGVFVVLMVVIIITCYIKRKILVEEWDPAIRIYRGLFLIFFLIGLLGVNVRGWRKGGVNHVLIFELDPRHHLQYMDILQVSAFLGVVWSLSCIAFLFSNDFGIRNFPQPLACGIFFLIFFLNPTRTFHFRARRWLMRILVRVIIAPFCPIRFADFWLADQLNSLVVAFRDFQYFLCFYGYDWYFGEPGVCRNHMNFVRTFVALLPAWWRFAQCGRRYYYTKGLKHLANCGKYSTSMFVTIISTIKTLYPRSDILYYGWILSLIIGTCYTLFWDIRMDWGLFAENAGENRFLREQIVYNYKAYYYLAVLADLIFRFLWTLTVSIGDGGIFHHEFTTFVIAICEVIRRFIWNFFRLENEHLNNVGEFRAVRDISIKPISSKEDTKQKMTLEQIMDSKEGPIPKGKAVEYILKTKSSTSVVEYPELQEDEVKNKRNRILSTLLKVV